VLNHLTCRHRCDAHGINTILRGFTSTVLGVISSFPNIMIFFDLVTIHFDLLFFATHHIGITPRATISYTSLTPVATQPSHLNTSLDPALNMGYVRASRGLITRLTCGEKDTLTNTIILLARMLVHATCMSLQHRPSRSRHPLTRAARHQT